MSTDFYQNLEDFDPSLYLDDQQAWSLDDEDEISSLAVSLQNTLLLQKQRKRPKRPPEGYLCHLCFCKGHYIKDCPQVGNDYLCLLLYTCWKNPQIFEARKFKTFFQTREFTLCIPVTELRVCFPTFSPFPMIRFRISLSLKSLLSWQFFSILCST